MKKIALALAATTLLCSAAAAYAYDDHLPMKADMKIKMMDTDGDGQVSRSEWDAFHATMFKQWDTNNDGMLSRDEIIAGMKKEMAMMKSMKSSDNSMKNSDGSTTNSDGTLSSAGNMKTGTTHAVTNDNSGEAMPTTR